MTNIDNTIRSITFFDTETTSNKEDAHLCQIACIQLTEWITENYESSSIKELNTYYNPPEAITFQAMAIHHITNEFISDYVSLTYEDRKYITDNFFTDSYIVAHNINFDLNVLKNDDIIPKNCKVIDTIKVAKELLPDAEAFNLQYLRYFLWLKLQYNPHDALDDIKLLKNIYSKLKDIWIINNQENPDFNINHFNEYCHNITINPQLIKKFTFGKHIGKTIQEVSITSRDYLEWLWRSENSKPQSEQNKDMIFTLKKYIN